MSAQEEAVKLDEFFSVECPALKGNVVMLKATWYNHILNPKTGHPYMSAKVELIKRVIKGTTSNKHFFRYGDLAPNEWFADYSCPDFKPLADFLRIGFKKLDTGMVIIASAYREKRGIFCYEP